jgi:hypothetical protein
MADTCVPAGISGGPSTGSADNGVKGREVRSAASAPTRRFDTDVLLLSGDSERSCKINTMRNKWLFLLRARIAGRRRV